MGRALEREYWLPTIDESLKVTELTANPDLYDGDSGSPQEFAERVEEIGFEAWRSADWVETALERKYAEFDNAQHFAEHAGRIIRANVGTVFNTEQNAKKRAAGFENRAGGVVLAAFSGESDSPGTMLGFVSLKTDISTRFDEEGSRLTRLLARVEKGIKQAEDLTIGHARPGHIYSWVRSLNVLPEHQGRGIGTALLHAATYALPAHRPMTMYVDAGNRTMQRLAMKSGFAVDRKRGTVIKKMTDELVLNMFALISGQPLDERGDELPLHERVDTVDVRKIKVTDTLGIRATITHNYPWLKTDPKLMSQ